MNQAGISAKAWRGYGIAAAKLGGSCSLYLPTGPMNPMAGAPAATILCTASADPGFGFKKPEAWGKPHDLLLCDPTPLALGAIVSGAEGTWFVSRLLPIEPAAAVLSDAVIDVLLPGGAGVPGVNPYGSEQAGTDAVLASGWPASIIARERGDTPRTGLPTDIRTAWCDVLMPTVPGVVLQTGLRLRDTTGRCMTVTICSPTSWGWQMVAVVDTA